jgi:hypothetical protein
MAAVKGAVMLASFDPVYCAMNAMAASCANDARPPDKRRRIVGETNRPTNTYLNVR